MAIYTEKARTYGVVGEIGGAAGASCAPKTLKDETAFDALYKSVYGVNSIQERLESLEARFFGAMEISDSTGGAKGAGIIGDISHTADTINSAVNRMHDILNRIERALP